PARNSSTATRVGLWDRGFEIRGVAPIINCLARRAATTTNANLLSGAWLSTVMRSSPSKRFQNLACAFTQTVAKTTCSHCDRLYFASGALDVIIDHKKIILRVTLDFLPGPVEPSLNRFLGILTAGAQPPLQLFPRGRKNKNGHGGRQLPFHLLGALYVNLEDQ